MKQIEKLTAIRKEKKITQTDMASMLRISRCMLWRYEKGRVEISLDLFEGYAEKLGFELKLMIK